MAGLDEGTYTLDKAKVMNLVSVAEQAQRQLKGEVAKLQDETAGLRSTWQDAAAGMAWAKETETLNAIIDHLGSVVNNQAMTLSQTTTDGFKLDDTIASAMGGSRSGSRFG